MCYLINNVILMWYFSCGKRWIFGVNIFHLSIGETNKKTPSSGRGMHPLHKFVIICQRMTIGINDFYVNVNNFINHEKYKQEKDNGGYRYLSFPCGIFQVNSPDESSAPRESLWNAHQVWNGLKFGYAHHGIVHATVSKNARSSSPLHNLHFSSVNCNLLRGEIYSNQEITKWKCLDWILFSCSLPQYHQMHTMDVWLWIQNPNHNKVNF